MKAINHIRETNLSFNYQKSPPDQRFLNPDESIDSWVAQHDKYRHPKGDLLKEGFAPTGMTTTDFTIIKHDGLFHLFGVGGYPGCFTNWQGQYEYIFHASTPNLIDWTVYGKALTPHPDHSYENNKSWPPFVFKKDDQFVMVYCALDYDNCQSLCMAFSNDLFHWERFERNPIVDPTKLDWTLKRSDGKVRHCRDPHVEVIDGTYYLYYSTVCNDGNPAVGLAASTDLQVWHDLGPCLKRTGGWVPESPLLMPRKGKFYLWIHPFDVCYISDDPCHFHNSESIPVNGAKCIAPEILDKRFENEYLIAFYGYKGQRISIGILAWTADVLKVSVVTKKEKLLQWPFSR